MALPSDTECVILGRESKRKNLELLYIVKGENAIHRAWRLAHSIELQEGRLGNESYKAYTAKCVEYFEGKLQIINPPKGFDFELPKKSPEEEEEDDSYILAPDRPGIPEKQLEKLPEVSPEVDVIGEVDVTDIAAMFKDLGPEDDDENLKPVQDESEEDTEDDDEPESDEPAVGISPDSSPDDEP